MNRTRDAREVHGVPNPGPIGSTLGERAADGSTFTCATTSAHATISGSTHAKSFAARNTFLPLGRIAARPAFGSVSGGKSDLEIRGVP